MTALKKEKTKAARADGEAYLLKNATKKGVITTASGLQYEVMKKGDGPMPTAKDKVEVHYHGTLIDGTVFDSSVDRGKTISFPVMGVIKGWQEALQLMHVGDKLKLTIPQSLAYGKRGAGANIPPYSTLVFEVELFGIQ
jgi:FKBP-type peptidyl-prolyl cis-trans isomerase FklB